MAQGSATRSIRRCSSASCASARAAAASSRRARHSASAASAPPLLRELHDQRLTQRRRRRRRQRGYRRGREPAAARQVRTSGNRSGRAGSGTLAFHRFGGIVGAGIWAAYSFTGAAPSYLESSQTSRKMEWNGSVPSNSATKHYLNRDTRNGRTRIAELRASTEAAERTPPRHGHGSHRIMEAGEAAGALLFLLSTAAAVAAAIATGAVNFTYLVTVGSGASPSSSPGDEWGAWREAWARVRSRAVAPALQAAVWACMVMSVMLVVEATYHSAVSLGVKLLGWKLERRFKWEPLAAVVGGEEGKGDASAYPMVMVQIPMYNELQVYKLSIGAARELKWPKERLIVQVLDDSTDPYIKRKSSSWTCKTKSSSSFQQGKKKMELIWSTTMEISRRAGPQSTFPVLMGF